VYTLSKVSDTLSRGSAAALGEQLGLALVAGEQLGLALVAGEHVGRVWL